MPSYPIYVPLLPDDAQNAIGQIHANFERPCQLLTTEGFEADNYIDIFDGGAVLTAELDRLQTLERNRCHAVEVAIVDGVAFINPDAAQALGVSSGDTVRVVGLQQG